MKTKTKQKSFKMIITALAVLATSYCAPQKSTNNVSQDLLFLAAAQTALSESNFVEDTTYLQDSRLGPENATISAAIQNSATSSSVIHDIYAEVRDGATGITVNKPISIDLLNGFYAASTSASNSYIANDKGQILYTRVLIQNNKITLIPQIRMQSGKTYTAVFGGITNANGEFKGDVIINYQNSDLDYGLYWYGKYGLCEKYFPGVDNAFYNPQGRTVVYAHGWQPDATKQDDVYSRTGFNYEMFYWSEDKFDGKKEHNGLRKFTNHGWVDAGWNTGMVYWNQFADEPAVGSGNLTGVHAAEAKIWSFAGPNGSRYRTLDNNGEPVYKDFSGYVSFNGQYKKFLSLYVIDALAQNTSGNIRMTGHSLGNQMITHIASRVDAAGIYVNRVALLDPAWTEGAKDYLPVITTADANLVMNHNGKKALSDNSVGRHFWVGEMSRKILFTMANKNWNRGFAIEIYHTTGLNLAIPVVDENKILMEVSADISNAPWYYSGTQISDKHKAIRHHYFWSYESAAPVECTISWWQRRRTGNLAADARTSDARIQAMMQENRYWV
ncbi:MAG: Ig-like domain-containing protein [Spirochaetota bacterium]